MNAPLNFNRKIEKLETLVDALLEERSGLRADLKKIREHSKTSDPSGKADASNQALDDLERLRARLADTEATNQQLIRERNGVRERLTQIRNRLDQVEAQLLEKRAGATGSKG